MIRRILLPLDGSERAETALGPALCLARAFEAEVVLLRVVEIAEGGPGMPFTDPAESLMARRVGLSYLTHVGARFTDQEIPTETRSAVGNPADEIVQAAGDGRTDLVILTSHGQGGESRFSISGTAHKVLTGSRTSVLLLPIRHGGPWSCSLNRILVPLDGSSRAEWGLRVALQIAASEGSEVIPLHVVTEPPVMDADTDPELRRLTRDYVVRSRRMALGYLRDLVRRLEAPGLTIRPRVTVGGSVPRTIGAVAREEGAGLVVATAHGSTCASGEGFGTVARGLLAGPMIPLLILQDAPARRWTEAPDARRRARPGSRGELAR